MCPRTSSRRCASGRATICCSPSRAASRSPKTRNSASTTTPTAPPASVPKWRTARARHSPSLGPRHASDTRSRTASEAAHLGLGLSLLEIAHDVVGGRTPELLAQVATGGAAHAQHRFGLLVFVVRQHGGD